MKNGTALVALQTIALGLSGWLLYTVYQLSVRLGHVEGILEGVLVRLGQ